MTTPARARGGAVVLLVAAVMSVAAVLAGCEFSHVNPQAPVHISGRALDSAGAPLPGAAVRLFKEADLGEAVLGVVFAIGTLGAVCLLPAAPAICRRARVATTSGDGKYQFDLKGSDTQGLIGTVSTLDVVFADPKGGDRGASTTIAFKARTTDVALPDARLWDAAPRLSEGGGRIRMSWAPLPDVDGRGAGYSAQIVGPARQATLWSQPAPPAGADIDARVLEDVPATAAVEAGATLSGGGSGGDVHASYLSRRLDVAPIAGAPPSRLRPCEAVSGTSGSPTATTTPQATCAATDGDLVTPARLTAPAPLTDPAPLTAPAAQVVSGVVIDLGGGRPVSLVVARGLAGSFLVEVGDDGVTFRQIGLGSGSAAAVTASGRPTARYVRVRSPSGLDESLLSEVSVW